MADISTGRQRGIVPFVDETTGRLPDQYLPQGVIDLQGDLEQAVSDASKSATAAKASETAASQSAQTATEQVSSIGDSVERAASSATAAAQSASEASASAQAAEASKTSAASSASAAKASETNAAASASAAKVSETNAAASATAAQQAVDGFGLEVGTTTTGDPGSDAAVEIQKNGSKYTANFTIPRGDKGDQASVAHDATLTGDGTSGTPLGVIDGTAINPVNNKWNNIDFDEFYQNGFYTFNGTPINGPNTAWITGILIVSRSYQLIAQLCVFNPGPHVGENFAYRFTRTTSDDGPTTGTWGEWRKIATKSDIPDVSALTSRIATLETKLNELAVTQTRLQALETRIKSLETNQ